MVGVDYLENSIMMRSEHITMLEQHVRNNYPLESCALLLGTKIGNQFQVCEIEKMNNHGDSKYYFEMDSDELMEAYKRSSREGIDIIGVFHSHLEDTNPSATDLIYMEINPIVWIIYSCKRKKFQAYLSDEKIVRVTIMVKD